MNVSEVPLSPVPQAFHIQLDNVEYALTFRWNVIGACWILDIASSDDVPIIQGIPVVTGINLLGQYQYLGFTGALIAQTDNDPDKVPTFTNLGEQGHLFYLTA